MQKRTLAELKEVVDPGWWETEPGQAWLRCQKGRDQWMEFLKSFDFDTWFTVTVDPKKYAPWQSGIQALSAVERSLKEVCKSLNIPCDAFVVSEEFKSGLYHVHGMLRIRAFNVDLHKMALSVFWRAFFNRHGRNSFETMRDGEHVGSYVSKYLTKTRNEVDWRIIGCR